MNIIDPEVTFNPNTMKLIHCNACDTTWAAKKIPAACPYCGKNKGKNGVGTASEDASMSWGEEYMEMMSGKADSSEDSGSSGEGTEEGGSADEYGEYSESSYYSDGYGAGEYSGNQYDISAQMSTDSSVNQDTGFTEDYGDDTYEPIGYDPDELANNMNGKKRVSKNVKKQLIADAEKSVKETKWALQRAGLPTDACQSILPDIRNKADSLEGYLPDYTELMIKMIIDNTLQSELKHPRRGRQYSISDVNDMLKDLDINENYWESYYAVAGLM